MSPISVATGADAELADILVAALDHSDEPLAATRLADQVPAPFKKAKKKFDVILNELATLGRLQSFPPYKSGKSPRYWTRDAGCYARELIVQWVRQKGPITATDVCKPMQARLKGWSKDQFMVLLRALVQERRIRELPPLPGSRVKRLSIHPPNPGEYLAKVFTKNVAGSLGKMIALLRAEGVTEAELRANANALWQETLASLELLDPTESAAGRGPMPPITSRPELTVMRESAEQIILDGMTALKPNAVHGAMVGLPDLRRHLSNMFAAKEDFDTAVLHLAEHGRVDLHRHNFPASLGDQEKALLVTDGQGSYYMGIVLRTDY